MTASALLMIAGLFVSTNVAAEANVAAETNADTKSDIETDTNACVSAHSTGQREAQAGRLKHASELFVACGATSGCPGPVQEDCERLLEKTRAATPTVILSAVDETGADLTNVKAFSSEELILDGLKGRAIPLDPGEHYLRLLLPDERQVSRRVLIREGEKNRLIVMQLEPKSDEGTSPATTEPRDLSERSPTPVAAWVATGFAGAGAATFGTFSYLGGRKKSELKSCAPSCPRSLEPVRRDAATYYLIADIGLGAAIVSSVVAVYLLATHRGEKRNATQSLLRMGAEPTAGETGTGLVLSGGFPW